MPRHIAGTWSSSCPTVASTSPHPSAQLPAPPPPPPPLGHPRRAPADVRRPPLLGHRERREVPLVVRPQLRLRRLRLPRHELLHQPVHPQAHPDVLLHVLHL